jgi:hypothetical protein
MSLVMCVLPKPRNMETEALEWCEVTSKTAALGDLDVAATLEAFARGQRGPGFGQHAVTSSPTYRLNGSALHISAFRSRLGFDQPSPGYGPARRRENSRLFPPFPPLTAFDRLWGIFLVFGGEASLGNFRRDGVSTRAPRDPRDAGATRENEASARQAGGEGDFWVAVECAPTDEGGKGPGFRRQAVLAFGAKGVHAQDAYFAGRTDSSRH